MVVRCSLINRLPPPPPTPATSSNPNPPSNFTAAPAAIPWFKSDKFKSRCMASVACLVIGLETNWAIAGDVPAEKAITAAEKVSAPKWSDKRMCPAWRLNSLEIIVPEDLPRPSAHRSWESVEFPGGRSTNDRSPAARGYQVVRGSIKGCFSM